MTAESRIAKKILSKSRAQAKMDAKYVRAIRESPLARWFAKRESKPAGKLPIPKFSPCDERRLALLVDELHEIRRVAPGEDTDYLEWDIDYAICELYGLDDDEITFIYRALNLIHQTDDEEDEALARWLEMELTSEDSDDFTFEEESVAILRGADDN